MRGNWRLKEGSSVHSELRATLQIPRHAAVNSAAHFGLYIADTQILACLSCST
jgi:hypothetical protein